MLQLVIGYLDNWTGSTLLSRKRIISRKQNTKETLARVSQEVVVVYYYENSILYSTNIKYKKLHTQTFK